MINIQPLIDFSRLYGSDPELVNAGGGNTSMKQDGVMYVKRSGTALSTADADAFAAMDMEKLMKITEKKYPDTDKEREAAFLADIMDARLPGEEAKRPSVETLLHALFPQKYVLHLHPALVNGLTCSNGGEKLAKKMFGEKVIWVASCRPGYILAMLMFEEMKKADETIDTVLLENHGVFFASETVEGLDKLLKNMMETLKSNVVRFPDIEGKKDKPSEQATETAKKLLELHGSEYICLNNSKTAKEFAESKEKAAPMLKPFNPDQIVYCGAKTVFVDDIADLEKLNANIVIVKGEGIYTLGKTEKAASTAMLLTNDAMKIAVYAESFEGPLHLSEELTDFIVNWEAESYRKTVK